VAASPFLASRLAVVESALGDLHVGVSKDKSAAVVREGTFEELRGGGRVEIIRYGRSYAPAEIVRRAQSRLGERGYHLVWSNCEHFARWCVTGEHLSGQVDRAKAGASGAGIGTAVGVGSVSAMVASSAKAGLFGGAGVMDGLAGVGGRLGTGAVGGLVALATAPTVAATIATRTMLRDDVMLSEHERLARQSGREAANVAAVAGLAGTVAAVAAAGVPGLSAVGISTGLAAIGEFVGGGMLAGLGVTVLAPALLVGAAGWLAYSTHRKRIS
jgi:hypothetical protein